jgi:type II secretory pathway predicted ATPase ExeA
MSPGYESFFGLVERPFSLTPDPNYFFKSRSHGRAIELLNVGLRRREQFLLVTGDLGVGKTTLCRTLVEQLRRKTPVSFVRNPLLTPGGLYRLLIEDFGALPFDAAKRARFESATPFQLRDQLLQFLGNVSRRAYAAVVVIDEAHTMPALLVEQVLGLAALEQNGQKLMQLVLVGQAGPGDQSTLGIGALDQLVSTSVRLQPMAREECAGYVAHRLVIAGAGATASFTPRAVDVLYRLSNGVPRLVNLLCERALQEAAVQATHSVESAMIDAAASDLELLRPRPKRFRWFFKRVS